MTTEVRVYIPGPPVPWQRARPRSGGKGYVNPKRSRQYAGHVRACARSALLQHGIRDWPLDGPYDVDMHLCFPDRRTRDDDNVEKAIKDACSGVLWRDDNWTRFGTITKHMGLDRDRPRVELVVRVVSEEAA